MISHSKNRVQAIKSKFENLNNENIPKRQLCKQDDVNACNDRNIQNYDKLSNKDKNVDSDSSNDEWTVQPNSSYLYSEVKSGLSDIKINLTRQTSDPGKKLHRSHAFRCERGQRMYSSPKRHGSCHGRSESNNFALKCNQKLSEDRLKVLSNFLEENMKKENFVAPSTVIVGEVKTIEPIVMDSIPDEQVPKEILEQYAKVLKPKKKDAELMTDSGVSSETENLDDDKSNRIKKLMTQFENIEVNEITPNLKSMDDLSSSSETMKLERKNPHLILTDTLKKALKQPLPSGPPPKKPPRALNIPTIPENVEKKKDPKKMLEKLEQVLEKRKALKELKSIPEPSTKKPKEIHYLCTEILDITQRTLLPSKDPLSRCLNSLNCTITNSTASLPYTRLSAEITCPCPEVNQSFSTFLTEKKCPTCLNNADKENFKCHLKCKCTMEQSEFFIEKEHIYDEPYIGDDFKRKYGTLNIGMLSRSMEDLSRTEDHKIYDIPFEPKRPTTPEPGKHLTEFEKLRQNFEKGFQNTNQKNPTEHIGTTYSESFKSVEKVLTQSSFEKLLERDLSKRNFVEKDGILKKQICIDKNAAKRNSFEMNLEKEIKTSFAKGIPKGNSIDVLNSNHPYKSSFEKFSERDSKQHSLKKALNSFENVPEMDNARQKTLERILEGVQTEKPPLNPKPILAKLKTSKSTENLCEEKFVKRAQEKRFSTDNKRYRNRCELSQNIGFSLPKRDSSQLDVDRENLNRLMNEIYDTVTAACNMDENKPGSFPTDQSDSATSEESVKLTRSLTEKRKNYVRRVSSRVAYLEPDSIKTARFRHQTSVCSYKSEIIDNPYSTFRSWKSFRTSQNNLTKDKMERRVSMESKVNLTDSKGNILSMGDFDSTDSIDKLSIDGKTGCVDINLPFEVRDNGLFNVCLLVGLNYMSGQAYVKSVFPSQVQVPPHIENLIFPETLSANASNKGEWCADANGAQCYSLVLTDERGDRSYGYCRRVLPEGATTCLPLCYCLIGKYRAPGFYYKVLQEIESHHGSSELEIQQILQQLFEADFPKPGESITIMRPSRYPNALGYSSSKIERSISNIEQSVDVSNSKTEPVIRDDLKMEAGDVLNSKDVPNLNKSRTMPDMRMVHLGNDYDLVQEEHDLENNNTPKQVLLDVQLNRIKTIKRPIEPRADEDNLSIMLDLLGAGLVVKIFGSLLLERKVIIVGDKLSLVSSCLEAFQSALYPMVWQQPLISSIPCAIQRDVMDAPLPILGGALSAKSEEQPQRGFQEGMLIDLTHPSKVLLYQGDESTILPTSSYKTLKTSLQMESNKQKDRHEDTKTRNVMISEAFLRFFVDILGDFWRYFTVGELKEGDLGKGNVVFDKDSFIKNAQSKQNQYFLEWFSETAMFNHFIQNMAASYHLHQAQQSPTVTHMSQTVTHTDTQLVDTPLPDYYELFHERVRSRCKPNMQKNVDSKSNYRNAVNRKVRLLKTKLRDLVA